MLPFIYPALYQEYRTSRGWRLFIYLVAPPLILVFLLTPFLLWPKAQSAGLGIAFFVLMLGLAGFFLFSLLESHKARFIVTADSLTYEGLLRRKVIPIANFKGYRTDLNYTYFISSNPADPRIKIGYTSENYAGMQRWFADRFPDLDQLVQEQEGEQLLTNPDLGATIDARLDTVAHARQTAKLLNGAGVAVMAWLLLHPQPYRWAVAAGLAVPLAAVAALWRHRGTLRLDEGSNSLYPSVFMALLLPLLALSWRAAFGDYELEHYTSFWCWAGAVAAGFALLLLGSRYVGQHQHPHQPTFGLAVIISAFLFGTAGTTLFNHAFDGPSATVHTVRVLGKKTSSGQTTTYYLEVSPWGPRTTAEIVTVPKRLYNQKQPGDSVHIYLHPGQLQIPWFEVKD